jgi:hypothetical protein
LKRRWLLRSGKPRQQIRQRPRRSEC